MQPPIFEVALRQIAVASITGYQKYISPKKGFSCAHRLLYKGDSCSQYLKRTIAEAGLLAGIKASRQRFAACKQASHILKTRYSIQPRPDDPDAPEDPSSPKKPRRRNSQWFNDCGNSLSDPGCDLGCDGLDCAISECPSGCNHHGLDCSGADCSSADCGSGCHHGLDCSGVDCSGLDCSGCHGLDCSGCDCSGADCGSCSW